jgi:ZIP family zinc transporter
VSDFSAWLLAGLIAAGAFLATMAGGLFALKLRDRSHLILGFSSGTVVAVALLDLIPEALQLAGRRQTASAVLSFVTMGFLGYLIADRALTSRVSVSSDRALSTNAAGRSGTVGAISLALHSLFDGITIGVSLKASIWVGLIVTVGVLVHDLSDGINTATIVLRHGGTRLQAFRWLVLDALCPALGLAIAAAITLPEIWLAPVVGLLGGGFLYIGASDLIPESHHAHPRLLTTLMTVLGAGVIALALALTRGLASA